ncbi:type I polyketide synthase [Mycobacterium attenuatum]|uniref:type I polyketide synthase n=1 Tax=Mycobacterium attenuatum TaxID=2341086 RepID=UPI000F037EC3|nr:beta-ketoacyl synthase N-terminal-like domain-containing protein [Mycobacterium attenuatum]VBA62411.1 Phenolphthiocerol synthesis polyketide synthase type I Pks15/1 [Mycobacterium attenuatum]
MSTDERIVQALRDARTQLAQARAALENRDREPIAIIGMGCRLPGEVDGPDDLWELVTLGADVTDEQPPGRWNTAEFYDPDPSAPGKIYATRGGFLSNIDHFDAEFFGISPREAESMDPQQRLLLEVTWETMEHAGITADALKGSQTGIFMGLSWRDYDRIAVGGRPENLDAYAGLGNTPSIAVGRIAHVLDLNGPVALIDTACSSSLVAVHQAVQSLRARQCHTAFAGGVNLVLSPFSTVFCCKIRALAPDGRCKTFDASADGYGRAEGCGVVLLKRLSDAQRDGDTVHAVIRGSAVNHDGRTGGLTVPSRRSQEAVLQAALQSADLKADQIGYIEAHGTGTALGDPIEIAALNTVFGSTHRQTPLWTGSIKTNIGHAETAAGIAGLIKTALAVRHGIIPPSLHFNEPNPHIDWDAGPVRVVTDAQSWHSGQRLAGVSSFGFSGTNAHVIVGQDQTADPCLEPESALPAVLTLSARTPEALNAQARRYAAVLKGEDLHTLQRVCYSANTGRSTFEYRLAAHAPTASAMAESLENFAARTRTRELWHGRIARARTAETGLVLGHRDSGLFTATAEIYNASERVREVVDQCASIAERKLGLDLRAALFADPRDPATSVAAHVADTVGFIRQLAIVTLMQDWGLQPAMVVGLGTGEYVAAVVAGILRIDDAIALIADTAHGDIGIIACTTDFGVLEHEIAASGGRIVARAEPEYLLTSPDLPQLVDALRLKGVAIHDARDERAVLGDSDVDGAPVINPSPPRIAFVSCQTGQRADQLVSRPEYWARRPLWPAHPIEALAAMRQAGCTVFVDVSGGVLGRCGREVTLADDTKWVSVGVDAQGLSLCAAKLFAYGAVAGLGGLHKRGEHRVAVPTYPFQRNRYWVDHGPPQVPPNFASASTGLPERTATDRSSPKGVGIGNRHSVTRIVLAHANRILGRDESAPLDTSLPLHEVGFDSLMAVELSTRLSRELGVTLQGGFVFDFPSISEQSAALTALLDHDNTAVTATDPEPTIAMVPAELTEAELIETALAELTAWQKDFHG